MKGTLYTYPLYLLLAGTMALSSCKKDDDDNKPANPVEEVKTGTLRLHLHNYVEDQEIDAYNVVYTASSDGRKMSFSRAQLYLSEIQLVKLDGSLYDVPGTVVLKQQEVDTYLLGKVPAGNYKSIKFKVGLTSAANKSVPTSAADDVLNAPSMWFGSTAQPDGYIFLNLEGKIDTTTDATASNAQLQPFQYHLGTDARLTPVTMPDKNYTVPVDLTQYLHILIDYRKLLRGVQLNNPANLMLTTPAENGSALAAKLSSNIPGMFQYEE